MEVILKKKSLVYTGCDNLEIMTEAVNYNDYLIKNIIACIDSEKTKVLDFGAGLGHYADLLSENGVKPDCLEPDPFLQEILKNKGYEIIHSINEAETGKYDTVYALNVLEHIENDQEMIEKLAALLKENGKLLIYVPAFEILYSSMDKKVGHYRRYRKQPLIKALKNAGLHTVYGKYCDPLGFLASLAYRLIGSKEGSLSPVIIRFYDKFIFPLSTAFEVLFKHTLGKNILLIVKKP